MHWLPPPCPHPTAVQEIVVCGHQLDPKDPPLGLVPPLSLWRYGIYPGHMGPISLSLSLFSLMALVTLK